VAVDPLGAELDDGRPMTSELFVGLLTEEMADLRRDFASPRLEEAALLFSRMVLADALEEFLTLPA
jgi:malate synthase